MIPADALPVAVDLTAPLTLRDLGRLEAAGLPLTPAPPRPEMVAALAWLALTGAGVPATLDECRDLTLDDVDLVVADTPDPTTARPAG